jgi:hypothetical protein
MPKLYEYFGLVVLFYSNEHEPIHVHGKFQGRESKAEIILVDAKAQDIVNKWIDYFVLHKSVRSERITQRLK